MSLASCLTAGFDLVHRAVWRLVGAPMQELRAVSESVPGEVIVLHFHHQFWLQRLPLGRTIGAPTARPAGRVARKAGRLDQRFGEPGAHVTVRRIVGRGTPPSGPTGQMSMPHHCITLDNLLVYSPKRVLTACCSVPHAGRSAGLPDRRQRPVRRGDRQCPGLSEPGVRRRAGHDRGLSGAGRAGLVGL